MSSSVLAARMMLSVGSISRSSSSGSLSAFHEFTRLGKAKKNIQRPFADYLILERDVRILRVARIVLQALEGSKDVERYHTQISKNGLPCFGLLPEGSLS